MKVIEAILILVVVVAGIWVAQLTLILVLAAIGKVCSWIERCINGN